jgi:hypothetical protein
MSRLKKTLTFSNAIALLALFIALGGSVYAASNKIDGSQIKAKSLPGNRIQPNTVTSTQLKKGTIGEPQVKANAITSKLIRSGAVTAGKIKPGSITASQIQAGSITGTQIKAGSISGSQIQSGSLGATQINQTTLTGISASNIHTVQYVTSTVPLPPETEGGTPATATCPSGMKVIGGGAAVSNPKFGGAYESAPNGERSGWQALGYSGEPNVTMTVTAICTAVASPVG